MNLSRILSIGLIVLMEVSMTNTFEKRSPQNENLKID